MMYTGQNDILHSDTLAQDSEPSHWLVRCWRRGLSQSISLPFHLLLFSLLGCSGSAAKVAESGPVFPDTVVSGPFLFSEIRSGNVAEEQLRPLLSVTNHSAAPQTITFDGTGCSCYSLLYHGEVLRPGTDITLEGDAAAEFQFSFATPPRPKESDYLARFSQVVGTETKLHEIRLNLRVIADLELSPEVLSATFSPGQPLAPLPLTVTLRARDSAGVRAAPTISGLPPLATVGDWRPAVDAKFTGHFWEQSWQTEVRLDSEQIDPTRGSHWTVSVEAEHKKAGSENQGRVDAVPLSLSVRQKIGVTGPSSVPLGAVAVGELKTRRILLRAVDNQPFRVTAITSDDASITANVEDSSPSVQHWIEIRCESPTSGPLESTLQCTLSHPETNTVRIQVTALVGS